IIVRRLTQIFKLKTYPNEETAAIGHAIDRMLDLHTYNLLVQARIPSINAFVSFMTRSVLPPFRPLVVAFGTWIGKRIARKRVAGSIGYFSEGEYEELLRNDLIQLQNILGDKKFLLGKEPTAVDCTAFGHLCAALYAVPTARFLVHELIESPEFTPLNEYIDRVEDRIFG
ncbi:hypothetical protein PFISCL1PPCAC_14079, partial [Pristionchus fissidentatus]